MCWRVYSWMRFTWTSDSVDRSAAKPTCSASHVVRRLFASRFAAR